jgi:YD repeat-containing protein
MIWFLIATAIMTVCSAHAITYTYDQLNRLKAVNYENGGSITYSYDATGNITAIAVVPDTTPPAVTSKTPAIGATSVSPTTSITVTFSEAITEASAQNAVAVTGPGGAVTGFHSLYYDTVTFTPSSALTLGATYTVLVTGAVDLAGNVQTVPGQWSFTVRSTATAELTVLTMGSSSGTVTSKPDGINCLSGLTAGCKASYPIDQLVTLSTAPAWYSGIDWTGCTATGKSCAVTMDADKSVTATFGTAHNAQLLAVSGYYGKIADAYAAANPSGIIQTRDSAFVIFTEDLLFDKPYTITLDGGKDAAWNTIGHTVIKGSLKIKGGRVTVKGIIIY